jgi:hypothetical protein
MRRLLVPLTALFAVGCATAPGAAPSAATASPAAATATPPADPEPSPPPPQPAKYLAPSPFAGGDGSSAEQAVVVLAQTEDEGIDLEHHWIFDHYGRFRKLRGGLASADDKHYDVVVVELGDHTEKTIYFDISGFYGIMDVPQAEDPPPPPQERRR